MAFLPPKSSLYFNKTTFVLFSGNMVELLRSQGDPWTLCASLPRGTRRPSPCGALFFYGRTMKNEHCRDFGSLGLRGSLLAVRLFWSWNAKAFRFRCKVFPCLLGFNGQRSATRERADDASDGSHGAAGRRVKRSRSMNVRFYNIITMVNLLIPRLPRRWAHSLTVKVKCSAFNRWHELEVILWQVMEFFDYQNKPPAL